MQGIFFIGYLVIGFVQLFAIMDGIDYAFGIAGFVGFMVALLTTYIPFVGAGIGIYGAVNVWDWSIFLAALLFLWFVPVGVVYALVYRDD